MADLLARTQQILAGEDGAITIRHLFYRLVGLGAVTKDERGYRALGRHLSKWRRSGAVAWSAFADPTRTYYGIRLFDDAFQAIHNTVTTYRKDLWASQGYHVEVWSEKDAIISTVCDAVSDFGVRSYSCRGFSSLTGLYNAAEHFQMMQQRGKEVVILHLGDHDPSGLAIERRVVRSLQEDFDVTIKICRIAVTPDQIAEYNLPTRPPKATDTRGRGWVGGCVEVDSMPMPALRSLLRRKIEGMIDPRQWAVSKLVEAAEHETLGEYERAFTRAPRPGDPGSKPL